MKYLLSTVFVFVILVSTVLADESVFEKQYDFITATEVLEHLHTPRVTLDKIWKCLKPNGWLGIMTKRATSLEVFNHWHYKNDPTHVSFFSDQTFQWLADTWQATLTFVQKDALLLRKK